MTVSLNYVIKEDDVIKMILEFLSNRDLNISQLSIERETGVHNGLFSDDVLFLRQLILDGQWDDCLQFIQPLKLIETFNSRAVEYEIYKHKYLELLCIRSEAGPYQNVEVAVNEVVNCLKALEKCSSKEDYNELCLLLTQSTIQQHPDYKTWNPSSSRIKCFNRVLPHVEKYLPYNRRNFDHESRTDRLIQLIIKGILYEQCVDYCQKRTSCLSPVKDREEKIRQINLLENNLNADLSLLSWLQSIPPETFAYPFEKRILNVDVEQIEKPSLIASWSEVILITPIKPKIFPHSATPFKRVRPADLMSKSLTPGVVDCISRSVMPHSVNDVAEMSRSSIANIGFHLKSESLPVTVQPLTIDQQSIDKLFESNDVFNSSCIDSLPDSNRELISNVELMSKSLDFTRTVHATQSPSSDLWRKFQKQRRSVLEKVTEESEFESKLSRKLSTEDHTPQELVGQKNNPNFSRLLASTPKNNLNKRESSMSPGETPITSSKKKLNFSSDESKDSGKFNTSVEPSGKNVSSTSIYGDKKVHFVPVTCLEDAQAIRAAAFHPKGNVYAIGSNSKTLRICAYPPAAELRTIREDHVIYQPTVLFKQLKHHKGSIYCLAWHPNGEMIATGSNDKTIKLMRYDDEKCSILAPIELTMHDGTIRDVCFMKDASSNSNLLISGGAGDCKIYITDCETATPFQALSGHSGHILSLYTWGEAMFVSGSQDRTIRFWDLRTRGYINLITAPPSQGSTHGSPVSAVCVDPSGRLLVSGHEDAGCMLYDIRGGRIIQTIQPHSSEIRTIRFSPRAYYLLTGGYDNNIILTDLQGDLTQPLPSIIAAEHTDKVIQGRWHPTDFTFLTTSADKTATLWALPV